MQYWISMEIYTVFLLVTTLLSILLVHLFFSTNSRSLRNLPPGPKGWPILGNLPQLGDKPHQTLAALAKIYGPLFHLRFGIEHVVVAASSSVAAQFLKTFDTNFSNRPPNSGAEHVAYNYQDLVFAPYGSRWRMLRKLCFIHLFSNKAMDTCRRVREEEVSLLVCRLKDAGGKMVRLGEEVNVCVTDALARAIMGMRVFGEKRKGAEELKEMILELMKLAGVFNIGDFVPGIGWLDIQGVVGKMKNLHKRYDIFLNNIIAEHERSQKDDGDLLSVMIGLKKNKEDLTGEGETVTDIDIKALLLNLFSAGTDTTTSTLEWALAELIRHPDILEHLQQEIDGVVGRDRLVSDTDLPNLPFLHAVIKEVFRLHPSTPLSLPRVALESCEVQGYHIPKNTTLLVNVWAISRDPTVWTDPLEFRPSRFLPGGDHANSDVKGNDFDVIPFGAGRRICAGMSLGLKMVQFLTATLAHSFDWKLPDDHLPENLNMEEAFGLTLQRAEPFAAHPVPRLLPSAYL
ncbi:hypothetical protein ZOSMA_7G00060 [Zostera marina]|uniref:Flavonoid 3'-monooxygenase n=1 Tax=Zostera marina TaxID=29655 RepID=A0A0K9NPG4_ZOSMR|nr:hypothetical protein ZOSMA_7G00060 [Zostera marina]